MAYYRCQCGYEMDARDVSGGSSLFDGETYCTQVCPNPDDVLDGLICFTSADFRHPRAIRKSARSLRA